MSGNKQPSLVTPMEHTLIGAVGGVMEVCLMQPMVAFKNALQEGRPMPTTPIQMYRGLLVSLAVGFGRHGKCQHADYLACRQYLGCVWLLAVPGSRAHAIAQAGVQLGLTIPHTPPC
eukprot:GHRQ01027329.1.p1 GENE.GHRQ01027329.1~~GHRQ01027329.1.p1  ORF type:complete len:117 (-),score=5.75 GHRQ01027329.1:626-976(-)